MPNIEKKRKEFGWTRKFLAAKVGITQASLFNYERGKRQVNIDVLLKLAAIFNCTVDELIKEKDA